MGQYQVATKLNKAQINMYNNEKLKTASSICSVHNVLDLLFNKDKERFFLQLKQVFTWSVTQ